ncbi:MAG: hypothetical protein IJ170_12450 [Ruminococcus sp.]|nr:hypothetical protein [Ruminococcus sp.]
MKIKRLILCMAAAFCVLAMCGANAFAAVTDGFEPAQLAVLLYILKMIGERLGQQRALRSPYTKQRI